MTDLFNRAMNIVDQITDKAALEVQLKLVGMEKRTARAVLKLRTNFMDETAKDTVITKFFNYYDMLTLDEKKEFRDSVDDLGKKYIDAWAFAGLYKFPFRDAVASTYLSSIKGKTNAEIREHIKECLELEKALKERIKALKTKKSVV